MNFQIAVEDKDPVTKVVTVSIPANHISSEIETALNQVANTVSLKGFRPGKAPRKLVEQLHGERVSAEVREKLIAKSFDQAIRDNKIDYIGDPHVTLEPYETGKELSYSAVVAVYPKPEIKYESFNVTVPKLEVQNAEVDGVVERIRESRATFRPIERKNAVVGDAVEFTVSLEVNGKTEGQPHKMKAVLSKGEIHPALEAGIVGMEVGEQKIIEPKAALDAEAAGKEVADKTGESEKKKDDVKYHVTLDALFEKELPEVTDAFVKSVDESVATVLEFRVKIREMLEKDREQTTKRSVEDAVLKQLVQNNQFQVPDVLIHSEIWNMLIRGGMIDPNKVNRHQIDYSKLMDQFGEQAIERVRGYIALDQVGEKESIKPTEEDLRSFIGEFAMSSGMSEKDLKSYFGNRERMAGVMVEVSRSKALEHLASKAKIEYSTEAEKADSEEKSEGEKPKKKKGKSKE